MRSLNRNKQKLYYATYSYRIPILDEDGFDIGETTTGYSKPVVFYANVSPSKGTSQEEVFGKSLDYSRSISTCDMMLPIDEFSRIWIDSNPILNPDGTADGDSADYSVAAIARSLNSVVYAIKRLPKSAEVSYEK